MVPHVDAVINVSSTVIWFAALMGKICCNLGTGEFARIADTNTLLGLNELLQKESLPPYRYDNIIYKRLTHNWVPETLMRKPEFLEMWIKYLCSKRYPKPDVSDADLKLFFAIASRKLRFSKRHPLVALKNSDLPLSYASVFVKLEIFVLRMSLIALPCASLVRSYISKPHRSLQSVLRLLKYSQILSF